MQLWNGNTKILLFSHTQSQNLSHLIFFDKEPVLSYFHMGRIIVPVQDRKIGTEQVTLYFSFSVLCGEFE